jgi:hypothetical protein
VPLRYLFPGCIVILLCVFSNGAVEAQARSTGSDTGEDTLVRVTPPGVQVTLPWVAAQLVPSPEWYFGSGRETRFGLRWQVTPILYSFGINRRHSPWRALVVEPMVRYNGSIEIFLHPEIFFPSGASGDPWLFRAGLRGYVPLGGFGEELAGSVGCSYARQGAEESVTYEAGLYVFFGIVGLQVSHSPGLPGSPWAVTMALRYF